MRDPKQRQNRNTEFYDEIITDELTSSIFHFNCILTENLFLSTEEDVTLIAHKDRQEVV